MDMQRTRRFAPMVYGIVVIAAFLILPGAAAVTVTIIGALLLGLFYAVGTGSLSNKSGGRNRHRNRR